MESKRSKFLQVLPILLHLFLLFQVEGKTVDFTDSWHQFSECFFKILCELDEAIHIQTSWSMCSNETIKYVYDLLLKVLPLEVSFTTADLVSVTFWSTEGKSIFCNLTEEEKVNLENDYGDWATKYLSENCTIPSNQQECEKFKNATQNYMEVFKEKVRKGQCEKVEEMLHSS